MSGLTRVKLPPVKRGPEILGVMSLEGQRRIPSSEKVEFQCTSSFVHPKLEAKHQVVKWTADEGLCGRLLPEGSLEIHRGNEITEEPSIFKFERAAGDFEFAGRSRLAIFVSSHETSTGYPTSDFEIREPGSHIFHLHPAAMKPAAMSLPFGWKQRHRSLAALMSVVYLAATFGGGKAPPAAVDVPPVGRRGALISPVLSLARGTSIGAPPEGAPSWAQELNRFPGLFEDFEGPTISWKPVKETENGDQLLYPSWLAGQWKVECKKRDVRFPQGWGLLSAQMPGVAMASILRLPNVGAEPTLQWRFKEVNGGAQAEWEEIFPNTLEGFWPDAHVAAAPKRGANGWALTYASPTAMFRKDGNLTERTVISKWFGSELWQKENQCYSVEWIRQTDIRGWKGMGGQDGVADYKVLMTLTQQEKGGISGKMRIAAFLQSVDPGYFEANGNAVPDLRDDLQRVAAPAEVCVWEVAQDGGQLSKTETMKAEVESGQLAELKWSSSGSALLVHCTTEVDDSGKSYYGVSKLLLASADGKVQKDLTEADATTGPAQMGQAVQAVEWSPTLDEFILIRGYQPAKVTLWYWDAETQTVNLAKVLTEKAHRNFISFNHFGSLVCIAGFGNLAGEVDFYGRTEEKCDFVKISKCEANCAVSADWAPDGRHLLTAVLFPRMRVDNGLTLWNALAGTKVLSASSEQLYEVAWRPGRAVEEDISAEEVGRATANADSGSAKKQAYKPPKARGTGDSTVAAMMRGEVAVPDEDRRRRPWQSKQKDSERISPRSSPPPTSPESEDANGGKLSPPMGPRKGKDGKESKSPDISRTSSTDITSGRHSPNRTSPLMSAAQPPSQRASPKMEAASRLGERGVPAMEAMELPERPHSPEQNLAAALAAQGLGGAQADLAALLAAEAEQRMRQQQQQALQQQKLQKQLAQLREQQLLQAAMGQGAAGAANAAASRNQLEAALATLMAQQQQQQQANSNPTKLRQQQQQQQQQQHRMLQQQVAASLLAGRDPQQLAAALASGYGAQAATRLAALEQQRQLQQSLQEEQLQQRLEQFEQQRTAAVNAATTNAAAVGAADKQRRCPAHGWQYIDPKNNVQGPFSLQEMSQWHRMGFFQQDLRMRCDPSDKFIPLKDLFPSGSIPFESYPRRVPGNGYA
eukprot:symbB.v1.2.013305.t3/scaffold936.1/size150329/2